eukprot:2121836-Pleurochrysis_carterae.AAC.1
MASTGNHQPTRPRRLLLHQCALGATAQRYTTFMCTPGLLPALSRLFTLTCTHRTHISNVGGSRDDTGWKSASHAAYPPDLNMLIAKAVASRITMVIADSSLPPQFSSPSDEGDSQLRPNVVPPGSTTDGL